MNKKNKKEIIDQIYSQISPMLKNMTYAEVYLILDAVKDKVSNSIYFIPNCLETPEAKH